MSLGKARLLVFGLGNPGDKYNRTRHNIGFDILNYIALKQNLSFDHIKANCKYAILKGSLNAIKRENPGPIPTEPILFAKPQTFMNLSGHGVKDMVNLVRVPINRVVVISDNMDFPLGKIKLKEGGGSSGQKGVESIIQSLGKAQSNFIRMNIGIGRPQGTSPPDYVLGRWLKTEEDLVDKIIQEAFNCLQIIDEQGVQIAMNKYNGLTLT